MGDGKIVHVADVTADPNHVLVEQRTVCGYRTVLAVPLMREGSAIGILRLTRNEVQPITDKQIELVQIVRRSGCDFNRERAALR